MRVDGKWGKGGIGRILRDWDLPLNGGHKAKDSRSVKQRQERAAGRKVLAMGPRPPSAG
jgi:hypothetical protein